MSDQLGMYEVLCPFPPPPLRLDPELDEEECLGGRGVSWLLGLALLVLEEERTESPPLLDVV